jgi:hypothetical protein
MIIRFSYFRICPLIASVKIRTLPVKCMHEEALDAQRDRKVLGGPERSTDTYYIGGCRQVCTVRHTT